MGDIFSISCRICLRPASFPWRPLKGAVGKRKRSIGRPETGNEPKLLDVAPEKLTGTQKEYPRVDNVFSFIWILIITILAITIIILSSNQELSRRCNHHHHWVIVVIIIITIIHYFAVSLSNLDATVAKSQP